MKKNISILVLIFLICRLNAQIKFGVTAGLHSTNLTSKNDLGFDANSVQRLHAGFFLDASIPSSRFSFRGQALYTTFGYKNSTILAVDAGGNDIGPIGNERIGYAQVPVLLLYRFGATNHNLKLGAGPWVGFQINESTRIANGGDLFRNTLSPANTSGPSSTSVGAEAYGSLQLRKFFIALDYQRSFTNLYQNAHVSNTKWRIGTIGFSLGIFLK